MTEQAVIFGAGNIGRGFLGQLLSESGYALIFVDIDETLIATLNTRQSYKLRLVDNDGVEELSISPVRALHAEQADDVAQALINANIAATAVGVRTLPHVAPQVAAGIARRASKDVEASLNIIVCENMKDAAATLRRIVGEHVPAIHQTYLRSHVGFVDTIIERIVRPLTPEVRARGPSLIVAEPYKELPVDRRGFVGIIPEIADMVVCDHFEAYTARKLYINNCAHATLAYLGHLRGHITGCEALEDTVIRVMIDRALSESKQGIVGAHGVEPAWLEDHIAAFTHRMGNRALGDTVLRLARDPIRKLGPRDRLVGAARLADEAGVTPAALAWGIAAGYCFDDARDPMAVALQQRIAAEGFDAILEDVSGIAAGEPLAALVRERYNRLQRGEGFE